MRKPGEYEESGRFWREVAIWGGGMVSLIGASFLYSKFIPSYHNPFFHDPVGMIIVLGIPTILYWWLGWGRRHIR